MVEDGSESRASLLPADDTTEPTETLLDAAIAIDPARAKKEAERVYRTFLTMTVCFSMNLGCITTVVAYASADFSSVGNYSNATLYGTYCIR
jgi:hypothetical protein